jgi:hypothetical protein
MISAGGNITSSSEELKKVQVSYLYHGLCNPKADIVSKIKQLRIVRNLDTKQYSVLKKQLPYVVCAMFNPPFRRTANFAYTEYFILDIDHIYEKGLDLNQVRAKVQSDSRVVLSFLSPGEDGLKLFFRFKERCYDSGMYSLFYKAFLRDFSVRYGLEQVIDERTSDVCRACFVSIDPHAYYNPDAELVDMNAFLPSENVNELFALKHELEQEAKENKQAAEEQREKEPDDEVMNRVKALLNPKRAKIEKPEPYVPERLEEIMDDLCKYVGDTGVELYEIKNIQYGKKMRFRMGQKLAEVNLFYGKRGFSVVQSPRCGTSAELNELMSQLIESFLVTEVGYE